jgi:hypothetical protein
MESTTRLHMFSSCQGDNHLLFMYTCYILGDDEATICMEPCSFVGIHVLNSENGLVISWTCMTRRGRSVVAIDVD